MGRVRGKSSIRGGLSSASLLMLAACGGGGGVNSASSGSGGSSGSTATTPAINYDDAEYDFSNAAKSANAITAWNNGATGTGETIAIVDSGIDTGSAEFAGRISSASRDVAGNNSVVDSDGHGTIVASVAAAARNGTSVEGIAFNATILALRTDTPGSCAASGGCSFSDTNIATAVDYARTNGAKVINMSLGGSSPSRTLSQAIDRATSAGIIVVIAAGNDATANPDPFAEIASNSVARGLVIIAGATDSSGNLSTFSDKAGSYAQYYLTALGTSVHGIDQNGTSVVASGTSFSAPAISAAVALLEQAFPNLTPAQVVQLLFSSATDAGATGVDSVYGNGMLNIAKAFQAQGKTSLAGSNVVLASSDRTTLSSAMGDAEVHGLSTARVVVLDALGRAYTMNVSGNVAHRAETRPLVQAIGGDFRTNAQDFGPVSLSATIARGFTASAGTPWAGLALGRRGFDQSVDARPLDGSAVVTLDKHTRAAFAFASQGRVLADTLSGGLSGIGSPGNFLAARGIGDSPGFVTRTGMSLALLRLLGSTALTVSAERGTVPAASPTDRIEPAYALMSVRAERPLGRLRLSLGMGSLREAATVLGSRLGPAFGGGGATTRYLDLGARLGIKAGWSLGAAWRQGWTRPDRGGVLDASMIASRSASADLSWLGQNSRFALRVAMPPRVAGGGLSVTLPTGYDYTTSTVSYTNTHIGLTPAGRERDVEASYGFHLAGGWVDSNVYWRQQPGNIATLSDDVGAALRYSLTF